MSVRLLMTDEAWAQIESVLNVIKSKAGNPPVLSDRMFIEAVLYQARTGCPWRDLPDCFGKWDAVYNRFRRWEARQTWRKLWLGLQENDYQVATHLFIDGTICRAHVHAAGAPKKRAVNRLRLWAALGVDFPPNSIPAVSTNTPVSR